MDLTNRELGTNFCLCALVILQHKYLNQQDLLKIVAAQTKTILITFMSRGK